MTTLKGGEKTRLGPQDMRNDMRVSSLGFLFASQIPHLELKKLATWKHQWVQTQKAPTKACPLKSKDQERAA